MVVLTKVIGGHVGTTGSMRGRNEDSFNNSPHSIELSFNST
jgi:hypothetical protein